jgi:hypothetical protein
VSKTFAQYFCLLLDIMLPLLEGMPDGLRDSRAGVQRAQQQESLATKPSAVDGILKAMNREPESVKQLHTSSQSCLVTKTLLRVSNEQNNVLAVKQSISEACTRKR